MRLILIALLIAISYAQTVGHEYDYMGPGYCRSNSAGTSQVNGFLHNEAPNCRELCDQMSKCIGYALNSDTNRCYVYTMHGASGPDGFEPYARDNAEIWGYSASNNVECRRVSRYDFVAEGYCRAHDNTLPKRYIENDETQYDCMAYCDSQPSGCIGYAWSSNIHKCVVYEEHGTSSSPRTDISHANGNIGVKCYRLKLVRYIPGESNVLITAPHGGYVSYGDNREDNASNKGPDMHTKKLAEKIYEELRIRHGIDAHIVTTDIHRGVLDLNRRRDHTANVDQEQQLWVWDQYHEAIAAVRHQWASEGITGLHLDIHGQAVDDTIMIGYGQSKTELSTMFNEAACNLNSPSGSDELTIMNAYQADCSGAIFGPNAFGSVLHSLNGNKYDATPRESTIPGDGFMGGGIGVRDHNDATTMDSIQLETPSYIRSDSSERDEFAFYVADAISQYLDAWPTVYGDRSKGNCPSITQISASSALPGLSADNILNQAPGTPWMSVPLLLHEEQWLSIQLEEPTHVHRVKIRALDGQAGNDPQIEGSNDGVTWTSINVENGAMDPAQWFSSAGTQDFGGDERYFRTGVMFLEAEDEYQYYRFYSHPGQSVFLNHMTLTCTSNSRRKLWQGLLKSSIPKLLKA